MKRKGTIRRSLALLEVEVEEVLKLPARLSFPAQDFGLLLPQERRGLLLSDLLVCQSFLQGPPPWCALRCAARLSMTACRIPCLSSASIQVVPKCL